LAVYDVLCHFACPGTGYRSGQLVKRLECQAVFIKYFDANLVQPVINNPPFYYDDYFVEEIDTIEDHQRVANAIIAFDEAEGYKPQ